MHLTQTAIFRYNIVLSQNKGTNIWMHESNGFQMCVHLFGCFIILGWSFVHHGQWNQSDLLTPISTSKHGAWCLAFFRRVTYLWIRLEHSIWLFKQGILMKNTAQVLCVQQMGPFTRRPHWHFGRGFPECGQMFVPESSLTGLKAVHVTPELFYLSSHKWSLCLVFPWIILGGKF